MYIYPGFCCFTCKVSDYLVIIKEIKAFSDKTERNNSPVSDKTERNNSPFSDKTERNSFLK